ncbi:MAG: sialate O-acetylesterase [Granulosicoccus sp.]
MPHLPISCRLLYALILFIMASSIAIAAGDPPDAPRNLQGSISNNQVTLTWEPSTDDDIVRGYNIYVNNLYTKTVLGTSYTGPVNDDVPTSFHVIAFDSPPRRFSEQSAPLVLPESQIPDDLTVPPSAPDNLTGNMSGNNVNLQWNASTDDEAVLGYNVFRDNRYLSTVSETRYTAQDSANKPHTWHVVAFDIRRNFSSRSETIRLPDTGAVDSSLAPSTPTGLRGNLINGVSRDTVILSWLASTDNQAVAGYNIFMNGDYLATRFNTSYSGSVPKGDSFAFQVVAFDFDQNFSQSSTAITLPLGSSTNNPGTPPSVPSGLTSESNDANGMTTIRLSWQPSSGPALVKGYDVYRNNRYVNTVSTTTFTDTLRIGTAASYAVVAFDFFNNYSMRSEPLSIVGSINQAPFFARLDDQQLRVGVPWELRLSPVDVDGDPAGILVSDPPSGVRFIDNGDGSRSLIWQPGVNDIGVYEVVVTAFDLNDISLRSNQSIQLSVVSGTSTGTPPFTLQIANEAYNLIEGDAQGVSIPINIDRAGGFTGTVNLDVTTETPADSEQLRTRFSQPSLSGTANNSNLALQLGIANLPLLPDHRRLVITARSGVLTQRATITLAVTPVPRDDIYLLIGQSNMVGLSEANAKRSGPGEPDEPDPRIIQANVSANDDNLIADNIRFVSRPGNFATPAFKRAEDPLHIPFDESSGLKGGTRIGMGLSFAKTALPHTTRNIVLVPAAWSGSAFCNTASPAAHWNANETGNPALGNTLLFDRALRRTNETLLETGGILRGILWHQGETDSNAACAAAYEANLTALITGLRTRILPDARGAVARGTQSDIPFVAGTMSRGRDERGDFSQLSINQQRVDSVHRTIGSTTPFSAMTNNDDLIPANGFPCGTTSCIHFGAQALREMGVRTYDSLIRAADNSR